MKNKTKTPKSLVEKLQHATEKRRRQEDEQNFVQKLQQITANSKRQEFELHDPKSILTHKIRRILSDTFAHPNVLEKAAEQGHDEYPILNLPSLLEEKELSHLTLEELVAHLKDILPLHQREVQKKGFQLILYALWFQNCLALSWRTKKKHVIQEMR